MSFGTDTEEWLRSSLPRLAEGCQRAQAGASARSLVEQFPALAVLAPIIAMGRFDRDILIRSLPAADKQTLLTLVDWASAPATYGELRQLLPQSFGALPAAVEPDVVAEVERLFCGPKAPYGDYRLSSESSPVVLVPRTLYRFGLLDRDGQTVTLQLYRGIKSIGGALWSREVRALLRVSARGHPSLPRILGGAYVEKSDVAFVITEAARHRLSDEGAMSFVASSSELAIRQLALLSHGLSLLHEQGITHRNLHPDSIEYVEYGVVPETGEARFSLRLARFEMSAMVSNLLRRQLSGEMLPSGDLRQLYYQSASETLAYCPPERAEWLFSEHDTALVVESDRSDIYSLGVLAWRWLVEASSPEHGAYEQDRLLWDGLEPSLESVRSVSDYLRARLHDSRIPRTLADLLRSMLAWDPRDRPSIFSVLRDLTQDYGRLVASLSTQEEVRAFHVGFMPVESKKTIYRWGWIDQDPESEEGREQLQVFLQQELKAAELLYCPEGFSAYQRARDSRELRAFEAAKYVLVGKQAYWFCDIYYERGPAYSQEDRRVPELLLIKYVRHHRRAWRLGETPLRRRLPGGIRFVPVWIDRSLDLSVVRAEGAQWRPLLRSVEFERTTPPWMNDMDDALSFLLAVRGAELDARVFPYRVLNRSGQVFDITVDAPRDRSRQYGDALRSLFFREMRVPMARLFESLDSEGTAPLAIYGDTIGRPDFRPGALATAVFKKWLDDDTVSVRLLRGRGLPDAGWIRPDSDRGSFSQLRHQENAVQELMRSRALLHQLHGPTAIKGIRARWKGVGDGLAGRSPEIVKDMLTSEPFYALHGPPGTGKTTVAKVAVAAHLELDPSQRVLVTSQSHYALDNLANGILAQCRANSLDVVAVRIASKYAVAEGKVHQGVRDLLPDTQASQIVRGVERSTTHAIDSGRLPDGRVLDDQLLALLAEWRNQVSGVELEIRDRIRRGANLVFATTGGCTERNVATRGSSGLFDWVIVEEAARAWPTELALPLVRGLRWTLLGDHFQLPAFDEVSVQQFLEHCRTSNDEELQQFGESRSAFLEVFRMFGSLFDKRAERRAGRSPSSRLVEPLDELDLQFRMHPDICQVVSQAFYRARVDPASGELKEHQGGWLKTHEETTKIAHDIDAPPFLRGRALVWIDTEGVEDSNDLRAWRNEGEVEVIGTLLGQMHPAPPVVRDGDDDDDRFALLSPYNAQIDALMRANLPAWTRGRIHTVDSFQGREADIVVVSLVRSTQRDEQRPEANIGYLVTPNRINVLLSRARRLLVIVGRIAHFERQVEMNPDRKDLQFWTAITKEVRRQGAVVNGVTLGGLR